MESDCWFGYLPSPPAQVDVAQSPLFNLAAVMVALESSFERLWTPELCAGLVRRGSLLP